MTTQGTPVPTGSDRGSEVKGAVAEESGQVVQTAKDSAQQVASEAKAQARDLGREVRTQVGDQASTQRDRIVGLLREIGDELREMADGGSRDGVASELARQAGDRVRGLGEYIDGRDANDLLDEVRSFARRRPGVFLLGAAAAGVVTGRLTRGVKAATSDDSMSAVIPARSAPASYEDPYAAPSATSTYPVAGSAAPVAGDPLAATVPGAWREPVTEVGPEPQYTGGGRGGDRL